MLQTWKGRGSSLKCATVCLHQLMGLGSAEELEQCPNVTMLHFQKV